MGELLVTGSTGRLGRVFSREAKNTWSIHPCSRSGGDDLTTKEPEDVISEKTDFVLFGGHRIMKLQFGSF